MCSNSCVQCKLLPWLLIIVVILCVFVLAVCHGVCSLDVPDRGHYDGVGIGIAGQVFVASEDTDDVRMYRCEAGSISLMWTKKRPQNTRANCWPCVSPDGELFLNNADRPTKHERYTAQLQETGAWYDGHLLAWLTEDRRAVRKETDDWR